MARKIIIIKEMCLLNFKGIRDLKVQFGERDTSICGRNGSGKTTIFDAFTWLLFGKDSLDRKSFNIKTKDASGKDIEKLPHEVSAILQVNGETISLCRKFNEKWTKRKGSAVQEFTGNTEERLYNDVPCSVKEWQEKIASICPEDVFKFITNPLYFSSQKADVQRAMLFRMAGGILDEDIAQGNADFEELLSNLTGKTLDEYKREIAAKKRRLKAEIEAIPERIDERKRDIPEAEDWGALEKELADKKAKLTEVEEQIADASKAIAAANDSKVAAMRKIGELEQQRTKIEMRITKEVQASYYERMQAKQRLESEVKELQVRKSNAEKRIKELEDELSQCKEKRERLIAEWRTINAEQLEFKEDDFICPTCKRPLEVDDIEAKQKEMLSRFNFHKSEALNENVGIGKANTTRMQEIDEEIKRTVLYMQSYASSIETKQADELYYTVPNMPDAMPTVIEDEEYKALTKQIEEATAEANKPVEAANDSELKEGKRVLQEAIDELNIRLSKREAINASNSRIAELEATHRALSEELATLEGTEFTIAAFNKAKTEAIEQKINGMFKLVRFKMYNQQINGGEVETCEATVNGVPYSDLNNAMRYNAGIDIINALCKSLNIWAPIFIDNAESINELTPTPSQVVRLVVTEDERLTIHNGEKQHDLFN